MALEKEGEGKPAVVSGQQRSHLLYNTQAARELTVSQLHHLTK